MGQRHHADRRVPTKDPLRYHAMCILLTLMQCLLHFYAPRMEFVGASSFLPVGLVSKIFNCGHNF